MNPRILRNPTESETNIAGMDIIALEDLISDVLKIENSNFASLLETLVLLEIQSAKFAALRRTEQDQVNIRKALNAYADKIKLNEQTIEEDLKFHLKIAEASKNAVLKSLISMIWSEIIKEFPQIDRYKNKSVSTVVNEHEIVFKYIAALEPEKAANAMRMHLKDMYDYSQYLKDRKDNGRDH